MSGFISRLFFFVFIFMAACDDGKKEEEKDVTVEYDIIEFEAPAGYARVTPNNVFEGSTWFAADIEAAEEGADFSGAQVFPPDGRDAIEIHEWRCNNKRCGVVLSIDEYLDSTAQPIPRPIDSDSVQLRIEKDRETWEATLTIFPLEISRSSSTAYPLMLSCTYMVSSFSLTSGASLLPNFSNIPDLARVSRLFVSGPILIEGTVDFSGRDGEGEQGGLGAPSAGEGGTGGASPGDAGGRGPGNNGVGDGGGGGGGHAEAGWAGTDGSGEGGLGGGSYGDGGLECARSDSDMCGGSGGGCGCDAGGGGGGGTLYLFSLDSITFIDAVVKVDGGKGADGGCGGGGGSGGSLVLVAPKITGNVTITADGGGGGTGGMGGSGGQGGMGRIRLDGNLAEAQITSSPEALYIGPAVDRDTLELIDTDGMSAVQGTCTPGADLLVNNMSMSEGGQVTVTCTAEGTFRADVPLVPGANELYLSQQVEGGARVYAQIGNTFDLEGSTVRGARLIIVSVPDAE